MLVTRRAVSALILSLLVLSGCSASVSVGARAVSPERLEEAIAGKITVDGGAGDAESAGIEVSCDDELPAEVDASVDCFGTDAEGGRTGFRTVVTDVDGQDVDFDVDLFLDGDTLAEQVGAQLTQQGYAVESLECEEVAGEVDATSTCTVQVEGAAETDELAITIKEVDGLRFRFAYRSVT